MIHLILSLYNLIFLMAYKIPEILTISSCNSVQVGSSMALEKAHKTERNLGSYAY